MKNLDWSPQGEGERTLKKKLDQLPESALLVIMGKSIRGMRISANLTLEELSSKCEVSKITLSKIENGKSNPTILTLVRIFRALGREGDLWSVFPEPKISPINITKQASQSLPRRVRKKKTTQQQPKKWKWGDE